MTRVSREIKLGKSNNEFLHVLPLEITCNINCINLRLNTKYKTYIEVSVLEIVLTENGMRSLLTLVV